MPLSRRDFFRSTALAVAAPSLAALNRPRRLIAATAHEGGGEHVFRHGLTLFGNLK